jgi:WD40 repeat protein/HEAT repeat protein
MVLACVVFLILGGGGFLVAYHWEHIEDWFSAAPPPPAEEPKDPDSGPPPVVRPPVDTGEKDKTPPNDPKPADRKPADRKPSDSKPPDPPPPVRHPPFEGHAGTVFRVAFSPDSQHALTAAGGVAGEGERQSAAEDSTLRMWDVRSGQQMKRWQGFTDGISAAAFSPGGRFALIAAAGLKTKDGWTPGADLDLHLWDLREGKELRKLSGHLGEVFCIAISADGKLALSGGKDRVIRLWEIETGREINRLVGHTNTVNSVAFTPDGRNAMSGSSDMTVRYWDLDKGKELNQFAGHQDIVWSVAIAPDGRQALSGGGYQTGPGNKGLVPGAKDFAIRVWDLTSGKELRRLEGHTGAVSALAFTPDSRRVLSASADHTVRLWLAATGTQVQSYEGHKKLIQTIAISPDGKTALSGGDAGELKSWSLPAELGDLQRSLREGTLAERTRAATDLGRYGTEAQHVIPDLLRAGVSEDEGLRRAVLASLVLIGKPKVEHLPVLEPLLLPAIPLEVRRYVLDTLAAMGADAKPAASSIAGLLKDADATLRTRAARALGLLGPKNREFVQPLLIEALRDTDATVSTAARQGLDALGVAPPSQAKTLSSLLADPVDIVRRYALDALTAMKENAKPAAADLVRMATKDESAEMRRLALQALAGINPRDKATLNALMQGLKDRDITVARQAIKALVAAGAESALPGWLAALEHKDAEIVKAAEEAMENTKWDKTHAKALGTALPNANAAVRAKLLKVLTMLGADAEDAVPGLRELLKNTEVKDALPLVTVLAKIGPAAKEAAPDLVGFLKRDPKMPAVTPLMLETAFLLVEVEAADLEPAIPILISSIRIEDQEEATIERRDRVMKALVKIGKPAVPRLARSLEAEYYIGNIRTPAGPVRAIARYKVMEVLVMIGPRAAGTAEVFKVLAYLERNDPFQEVRVGANQARIMLMQKDDAPKEPAKDDKKVDKKDG